MDRTLLIVSTVLASIGGVLGMMSVHRGVRSRWTVVWMVAAFLCQIGFLSLRGGVRGACPLHDFGEKLVFLSWSLTLFYLVVGPPYRLSLLGVFTAHLMFAELLLQTSRHVRTGGPQWVSEFIATFGLLCVIWGCGPVRAQFSIGLYIVGAYWFTASTSFANPAVTIARAFTDTFAGIRPQDAPGFILAQFAGALVATALLGWLTKKDEA